MSLIMTALTSQLALADAAQDKQISAHAASAHTSSAENQPLWSKDQQKQAELEKKYQQAIANNPDNKKNYAYLAGLYLSSNKSARAIEAYQEAIIHDPENPKLFAALSIAYLHQSKFGMAKAMADQALKIDPSLKSVNKINEYIVAKEAVINAASKVPAGGKIPDMSRFDTSPGHGSTMPEASGDKPSDKMHNSN